MSKYLFIESRDPLENRDCDSFLEMVQGVATNGNSVTLFLIQIGVFPLRKDSGYHQKMLQLMKNKVQIKADGFSLRERAISSAPPGIAVCDVDELVRGLLDPGTKSVWH